MPVLIDLQAELVPVEHRMMKLDQSLKTGVKFKYPVEQAESDKQLSQSVQAQMTEVIQQYSNEPLKFIRYWQISSLI